MNRTLWLNIFILLWCQCAWVVYGDEPLSEEDSQAIAFFETEVRPLLVEKCFKCHGEEGEKGGLRLDSQANILAGGESGPALVPFKSAESLLLQAVRYEGLEMPPDGKLSQAEIDILEKWVDEGAKWPGEKIQSSMRREKEKITDEDRAWWAIQPVTKVTVPDVSLQLMSIESYKPRNEIDAFIIAKMNGTGLKPAPEADRVSLIRRLAYDLTGLPPTAEEVDAFVNDDSPNAYDDLVERYLDSPQYGERWARHWLDLVRYADSDGYRIDHYRPNAWQYRDYVIRAFNEDKPYDRFVQEQIAGDELYPGDTDALIATGFLRHWIYEYNSRDAKGQWDTILNDITDTTGDVFLGLGMQCAKCHDHKFDPILQKDYYRLRAFFSSIYPADSSIATDEQRKSYQEKLRQWEEATAEIRMRIAEIEAPHRAKAADTAIGRFPPDTEACARKPADSRNGAEQQIAYLIERQVDFEFSRLDDLIKGEDKEKRLALKKELAAFDEIKPIDLPTAMTVREVSGESPETVIPKRNVKVLPGFLSILQVEDAVIEPLQGLPSSGRRATLAKWLTDPKNPLTARVIVNRVWQYHFGKGMAPNSSDFGRLGGTPSHPELLDWLTSKFLQEGWSLKSLHRAIVQSATYRQSASHSQMMEYQRIDPTNQYYWRSDVRRLDAEQIRDSLLAVSGLLQLDKDEKKTLPENAQEVMFGGGEGVMADVPRRSIYTRVMRNARDPLLEAFDLPLFFSSESTRNTTTSPVQSLLLINSPQLLQYATALARRVDQVGGNVDLSSRISHLWRIVYGRPPNADELEYATQFVLVQKSLLENSDSEQVQLEVKQGKLPYRDGLAVVVEPSNPSSRLRVEHQDSLGMTDFTIEGFMQLRSVYDSGSVRTIASKWSGSGSKAGWGFGVTGKGSRRKPQTLVMQMWGKKRDGSFGEAAIFSDQNISLNSPYYVAAVVRLATKEPGSVTFFLKDLSNDDEPMQSVTVQHDIVGGLECKDAFVVGGRAGDETSIFDGLLDDIRLSRQALQENSLLMAGELPSPATVGYWRFEQQPGVFENSIAGGLQISTFEKSTVRVDPGFAAFRDLCHAVINSNEFLYVR